MTALCEFQHVGFAYPAGAHGRPPFEIRDLSFALAPGEVLGLIGPNAAGKTTVIRLLSRVLEPSRGEVLLAGRSASRLGRAAIARQVAVVPQDVPQGFPYTVEQLVLMGRFPHAPGRFFESREDLEIAREAMALTGVEALAAEPLDRLSGGERQRVVLARATRRSVSRCCEGSTAARVSASSSCPTISTWPPKSRTASCSWPRARR